MRILIEQADGVSSFFSRFAEEVSSAFSGSVFLFVVGLVLIALLESRMERLELEVAARPVRAFALGLLGFVALGVLAVTLCVTIIGIPFAAVLAIAAVFGAYAGVVAVLRTFGAALIGHRTANRYVHLAFGIAAFFVVGLIPWLGDLITFALLATGLGTVLATRAAGLWQSRDNPSSNGYAAA